MKRVFIGLLFLFVPLLGHGESMGAHKLKISLDTAPNHLRNQAVERFAVLLKERLPGQLQIEIYPSGQLHKDRDIPKALVWGNVAMGLVSVTGLVRYEPNVNLLISPALYGLDKQRTREITYGYVGQAITRRLEQRLGIKILTPNLDLGFLHTFSTDQPVVVAKDLVGKKIRVPGGAAQMARFKLQGATPVAIPWSDVPLALAQGAVDGVFSSYETVRSGKLWDAGIRYAYEDRGAFIQYLPMISTHFWNKLNSTQQQVIEATWRQVALASREDAKSRQAGAREELKKHGVSVVVPDAASLEHQRQQMLQEMPRLAEFLRMDKALLDNALSQLVSSSAPFQEVNDD